MRRMLLTSIVSAVLVAGAGGPTDVEVNPGTGHALVSNQLADTLSMIGPFA